MNQKGFTLVEILAVLVVLIAIIVLISPNVINLIQGSKDKLYNEQIKRIKEAADIYVTENYDSISFTNGVATITLSTLIEAGYLDSPIKNPKTRSNFSETDTVIEVTKSGSSTNYVVSTVDVNLDTSGANAPEIYDGLIPVYYDEDDMVWRKADSTNTDEDYQWYSYKEQMWANAVTVTSTKRTTYQNAKAGTEIPSSDINTFWVWIPRYSYRIPSGSGPRAIYVKWEKKTTTRSVGDGVDSYYTLPGFTFGTVELSGIWIGKFELTGTTSSLTMKPNLITIRTKKPKLMYDSIKSNMQSNTTTYGFTSDSDIHLSKNTEWATMTYLSGSKYGKYGNPDYSDTNKEIYTNNSTSYYSGRSSGAPAGASVITPTNQYTASGYYTYNGTCAFIYTGLQSPCSSGDVGDELSNKNYSYGTSTTGNIYGVYDTSGPSYNRVMMIYKPTPLPAGMIDTSGFSSSTTESTFDLLTIDPKYYDVLTTSSSHTACNGECYGQALYDVSDWYNDESAMPYNEWPWLNRGNHVTISDTTYLGIYSYDVAKGNSSSQSGYRITIVSGS